MTARAHAFALFRTALLPALCLVVAAVVMANAATGANGLVSLRETRAARLAAEAEARHSREAKAHLEHRIALLDPARVDPDLADELVRRHLGVVRPDEVVIPLASDRAPGDAAAESD